MQPAAFRPRLQPGPRADPRGNLQALILVLECHMASAVTAAACGQQVQRTVASKASGKALLAPLAR